MGVGRIIGFGLVGVNDDNNYVAKKRYAILCPLVVGVMPKGMIKWFRLIIIGFFFSFQGKHIQTAI